MIKIFYLFFIILFITACSSSNVPEGARILSKKDYVCKEIKREPREGRHGSKFYSVTNKCVFVYINIEEASNIEAKDNLNKLLNEN